MKIYGKAEIEKWPLKVPFVISRSSRTHVKTVSVSLTDGLHTGWGECQPNSRFGENPDQVKEELQKLFSRDCLLSDLENQDPVSRSHQSTVPLSRSGMNALDCALWDLKAKQQGVPVWYLTGQDEPGGVPTYFTVSLDHPEKMANAAYQAFNQGKKRIKLKLGSEGDIARLHAVRHSVPDADLIVDANEGWQQQNIQELLDICKELDVLMVEQPLPAGEDDLLREISHTIPICADEACKDISDLEGLVGKYDLINIKLDKAGGLTTALDLYKEARRKGFGIMVGCMLGTSRAIAPAHIIAQTADFADLDGFLLLSEDRKNSLIVDDDYRVLPPAAALWG